MADESLSTTRQKQVLLFGITTSKCGNYKKFLLIIKDVIFMGNLISRMFFLYVFLEQSLQRS